MLQDVDSAFNMISYHFSHLKMAQVDANVIFEISRHIYEKLCGIIMKVWIV